MKVTRLEIFGFKSFVERFALGFDKDLIGIVGPNGCGKSNIVDALRWVLGETQAKQLRGGKQEDLIFNGSDSRRALGMAEVSLSIRPTEGWAEAVLSQAAQQQDELAQLLNAETVPTVGEALDASTVDVSLKVVPIHQHIAESSPGMPQLGLAQGNSAVEASTVRDALSQNADFLGLLNAAEIQLTRRLYRSGESEYFINRMPCRLRDMLEVYRLIGMGARGLSIVQQGQIGQIISKKPVERRELLEEAAGISGFRNKLEAAQRKLERTCENMARLQDIVTEVDKQVRVLKRQAQRAKARNELKVDLEAAELGAFSLRSAQLVLRSEEQRSEGEKLCAALEEKRAALSKVDAQHSELQVGMEQLEQELYSLRQERDQLHLRLEAERERRQQLEIDQARNETELQSLGVQEEEFVEREQQLLLEQEQLQASLAALEAKQSEKSALLLEKQEEFAKIQQQVAQELNRIDQEISSRLQEIASDGLSQDVQLIKNEIAKVEPGDVAALERAQRTAREELAATRKKHQEQVLVRAAIATEIASLQRQLRALAEHVAEFTLPEGSAVNDNLPESSLLKTLAAELKVPEKYQRAVQAVLGSRGNFLLSEDALELAERYAFRQSGAGGQKREEGAKVGVLRRSVGKLAPQAADYRSAGAPELTEREREAIAPEKLGEVVLLGDVLHYDSSLQSLVQTLIGQVLIVPDLLTAVQIQRAGEETEGREQIVTLGGEVVTPWGWYTTEGAGVSYSFTRRIDELTQRRAEVDPIIEGLEGEILRAEERIEQVQGQISSEREKQQQLAALQKKLAQALESERQQRNVEQQTLRQEERKLRESAMARERAGSVIVAEASAELARVKSQRDALVPGLSRLEGEFHSLARRRAFAAERRSQLIAAGERLQQEIIAAGGGLADAERSAQEGELERLGQSIRELETRRNAEQLCVAESAQELTAGRREVDALNENKNRVELALEKATLEIRMLCEDIARYYPEQAVLPGLEQAQQMLSEGEVGQRLSVLQEQAVSLRRRLEREGEVDPESIERHEQEQARLENLNSQLADLQSASAILERTIKRLKELSRARFLATYQDVSQRFAELIPRLFGGGAGHMQLIDSEDPLSSGVEIFVRPPGKKPSNMELLSGGEKALVATAVLVAMFLHRPSPLCVLDEVDAPLDDANLERFIGLVREIAQQTQFLIITHNKNTMSAMERLIGITMQESGVSTALSVTLEEVEADYERWVANAA